MTDDLAARRAAHRRQQLIATLYKIQASPAWAELLKMPREDQQEVMRLVSKMIDEHYKKPG